MPRSRSGIALFAFAASVAVAFAMETPAYASGGQIPPHGFHTNGMVVIDWSQLGPAGTMVDLPQSVFLGPCFGVCPPPPPPPSPFTAVVTSTENLAEVINGATYPPGQALLRVNSPDIELMFDIPVLSGINADFQSYNQDPFIAHVTLDFTPGLYPYGTYSFDATSDGSPITLGWAASTTRPNPGITSMAVDLTGLYGDTGGLVVGTVFGTVPEPATWAALLVGSAGLGLVYIRRARREGLLSAWKM